MFIAPPAIAEAATESVRRLLAETAAGLTAPGAIIAAATVAAGDRQTPLADLQQRMAGRIVPALVLSRIDQEQGTVEIAGEHLHVAARLPEAGRSVMLRFAPAADAIAAASARQAEPESPSGAGSPTFKVVVSAVAQALSQVASREAPPLALGRIAAAVQTPQTFAPALAALVRDSGVFYESHLARWSRGQYPLAQLQIEPQARSTGPGPAPAALSAAAPEQAVRVSAAPDTHTATGAMSHAKVTEPPAAPLVANELQPILREQLGVLERHSIAVTLEAWCGQQMALSIRDQRDAASGADRDQHGQSPAIEAAPWATHLSLDLPRLGKLHVELGLTGNRMQLVLKADADSAACLGRATAALADALAVAGIGLSGLRIVDAAEV